MTRTTGRKTYVHVSQDAILEVLREVGPSRLDDLAEYLDVSPATVRRKLNGAVAQGKATRWDGSRGSPAEYGALDESGSIVFPALDPDGAA